MRSRFVAAAVTGGAFLIGGLLTWAQDLTVTGRAQIGSEDDTTAPETLHVAGDGYVRDGLTVQGNAVLLGSVHVGDSVSPAARLIARGGVRIGGDPSPCTDAQAGAIRFTGATFEGCDGQSWKGF